VLPTVAIVMPAYNAAHLLPRTLSAAKAAAKDQKVLVVDPGSTDETAEVARSMGVEVIRLEKRAGPAHARNVGVEHVDADVLLFIDSDCVAHPDVVDRVRRSFAEHPDMVSLTGSYDDAPPEPNFFSQYMNLRHHFIHQKANTEDASFWAGCGAVKRSVYQLVGGFDAARFPMPMIEDIELGLRLRPHGKTRLDPGLHVTHLKKWTLRSVIETDIKSRALPWSRLILDTGRMPNDLNLRWSQRISAALAPAVLGGVLLAPVLAVTGQWYALPPAMLPLAVSALIQRDMIASFSRARGPLFGAGAWLFHQVHLIYSAATYAYCLVTHRAERGRRVVRTT
jgi:glycosyltransferase involved in cell wall biosynthesis